MSHPPSYENSSTILSNYHRIITNLSEIAKSIGLPPTQLMVVTKNQPIEKIIPLLEAGHRFFGENRVQEALLKWPGLKKKYPDCRLHLIGPLQRNKITDALHLFDGIESIDRENLVDSLAGRLQQFSATGIPTTQQFLIQINVGQEPQKSGVLPEDFPKLYQYAIERALPINGLMCIPPADQDPTPYFTAFKELAKKYQLTKVSMGMSNDYPLAASLGASWARVGSRIFETLMTPNS